MPSPDGTAVLERAAAEPRHLLDSQELAELGPAEAIRLPIAEIDPSPDNPRKSLIEVDQLAESIADPRIGLLQPIMVRHKGERYEVLAGHRRLAAFQLLREHEPHEPKWRAIPAVVRTSDDGDAYRQLVSAQVHFNQWKPKEQAAALERMVADGLSVQQIGAAVHRTHAWASKRLRVYADAVLSPYVQTGRLPASTAEELLPVTDVEVRKDLAERAARGNWGQVQARAEVRKLARDEQVHGLHKRVLELHDILSSLPPERIDIETFRDLQVLRGYIERLSGQARARVPTIEEAEKLARVPKSPRKQTPKRRTKFRTA